VNDSFNTKNVYNGAQIGLGYMMWRGKWMLDARGLVGLGGTCSTVTTLVEPKIFPVRSG